MNECECFGSSPGKRSANGVRQKGEKMRRRKRGMRRRKTYIRRKVGRR